MKQHDVIISGLHMDLTPAIKQMVQDKVEKLFKHEEKIIRLQIELEYCTRHNTQKDRYLAKGHIEIRRKPIVVSTTSDDNHFQSRMLNWTLCKHLTKLQIW